MMMMMLMIVVGVISIAGVSWEKEKHRILGS